MAAPNTNFSYGHDLFGDFQIGVPRQPLPEPPSEAPPPYTPFGTGNIFEGQASQVPAPYGQPRDGNHSRQPLDVASLSHPIAEIAATALRQQSCMSCRGQRYDYAAYFHNNKIFSRPPHELLKSVEESHVLKNRLQSLLVNYVLRDVEQESFKQIQKDLQTWETRVNNLAMTLGDNEVLGRLRAWTSRITRQLWEHVTGVENMEMPPGRMKELISEFRKLWEDVWVRCVSMKDSAMLDDAA
jgi:hypothetical protein